MFPKLQAVTSLPEHSEFSPLSHFNKNKLLVRGVDSSHSPPSNSSRGSSTAVSFTTQSATLHRPHPHHVAKSTLFSSSFLFPSSYFTLSLQHSAARSIQTAASHSCQPSSSCGWPRQSSSHPRAPGLLTLMVRLGHGYD